MIHIKRIIVGLLAIAFTLALFHLVEFLRYYINTFFFLAPAEVYVFTLSSVAFAYCVGYHMLRSE